MSRRHASTLELSYDDARTARTVARSVSVETAPLADERSDATVERDGDTVVVALRAADLVALRAATNTWTSLVATAERAAASAGCDT